VSTQVLARKWRPKSFTDGLVGQEHVVRALSHALEQNRLHHAYLFTGTRGVGKTTLSRILAKSLNCIGPDGQGGVTSHPCGVCAACTAIDAGRFIDYVEMDAASNRGVDDMAALLDRAVYAPTDGRFKVYMIDEVHMLSNTAFNSMLKTLEEPPEHLKFILATTDPQKIPVTVLSRCLQFNLKQMTATVTAQRLTQILQAEGISADETALKLIARAAHGSMRDALSLTDQAIAFSAGSVTEEAVRDMLGAVDTGYLVELLDALAARDGAALLAVADRMSTRAIGFEGALADLAALLHRIAMAQVLPDTVHEDLVDGREIVRLAARFAPEDVQLFYAIALKGSQEIAWAPDPATGFSMTLLRMLAFLPDDAAPRSESKPLLKPAPSRMDLPLAGKPATPRAVATTPVAVPMRVPAAAVPVAPPFVPAAPTPTVQPVFHSTLIEDWPRLATRLPLTAMAGQLATQSVLISDDGALLHLQVPIKPLADASLIERLQVALAQEGWQRKIRVDVAAAASPVQGRTGQHILQDERAAAQAALEAAVRADPLVQDLISTFDATIVPGSIKPL
jgi:DNA polymerase-3 subunit gamma/tau